ncbi:hypothetical protein V1281_006955 [Nitrobacteraceae bacterium AZCC 2161]
MQGRTTLAGEQTLAIMRPTSDSSHASQQEESQSADFVVSWDAGGADAITRAWPA